MNKVRTAKDVCLELGINWILSLINSIETTKSKLTNFFFSLICFMLGISVLFCLVLTILALVDNNGKYIVWTIYILINMWITTRVNTVLKIVILLISIPAFITTVYLEGKAPSDFSEGLGQFILLLFSYAAVWIWGAISFNDKQYKVAISFIDASITTTLAICAYIYCVDPKVFAGDAYKTLGVIFSPFVIARVWGKWALDLVDLMDLKDLKGKSPKEIREKLKNVF